MNKKKLITFVLFAYGISWLIWMPNVLAHSFNVGWGFSNWRHIAGGLGPFFGAVITTYLFDKRAGVNKYFKDKLFAIPSFEWALVGFGMPIVFFPDCRVDSRNFHGGVGRFLWRGFEFKTTDHEPIADMAFLVFFLWVRRRRRLARISVS
jgi:hypothetical protein